MGVSILAFYKFTKIKDPVIYQSLFLEKFRHWKLKGLMLLGNEGINSTMSMPEELEQDFRAFITSIPEFADLQFKKSSCDRLPFKKLQVKIKQEIVTFHQEGIDPETKAAPYISPKELKKWYDEGKEFTILDTRNSFEYEVGTFKNAVDMKIRNFVDFPEALEEKYPDAKERTFVTFCTGGIRCEKAAPYMQEKGYKNVYQLDGGILNYFQECGGDHYEGDCFVFDHRVAVDSNLQESKVSLCTVCQKPMPSEKYKQLAMDERYCPDCQDQIPEYQQKKIAEFEAQC